METQNNQHTFSYMMVSEVNQATIHDKLFTLKFEDQGKEICEVQVKTSEKTLVIVPKSEIKQDGEMFQLLDQRLKTMDLSEVEAFRIKFEPQALPAIIDCNPQYGTCNFALENASEGALDLALQESQANTALDKIAHEQKKSYIAENIENRRKLTVLSQQSNEFKQLQKIHENLAKQYQVMTLSQDEQQTQLAKQTESIASLRAEIKQLKEQNQGLNLLDEQKTAQLADKQQKLEQALQDFDHFKQQIDEINAKYGETETGLKAKVKDFFMMILNQIQTKWYGEEVMKLSALKSKTQDYAKALEKLHEDKKAFVAQQFEMAKQFDNFLKTFEVKKQGWGDWVLSFFYAEPVETDLTKLMDRAKNAISLHQKNLEVNRQLSNEISQKNAEIEAITDKLTESENQKIRALLDNIALKDKQIKADLEVNSVKNDLSIKNEHYSRLVAYKTQLLEDESLKLKDALKKIEGLESQITILKSNEKLQLDAYFKQQFEDFKQNLQASHALNEDLKNAFDKIKLQKENDQALIAELTDKVKKYEAQNPKFREFIEALQMELDGKDQAHEKLKLDHDAKVKDYQQLEQDKAKQQAEYDEYKRQSDEKYSSVNNEKLSAEENLRQTEANLLACRNEKDQFFSEKQNLQAQIHEKQAYIDQQQAHINNLNGQLSNVNGQLSNANVQIDLLREQLNSIVGTSANAYIQNLTGQLASAKAKINYYSGEINKLQAEIANLKRG
ncbi:hypothetical protein [Cysteiniphilum sp. 5D8B4]|uniref:hypothetical protein n=2 Tax=unclassified Cysteiniphilum TaxID=2610889 RepID=UPI003F83149A